MTSVAVCGAMPVAVIVPVSLAGAYWRYRATIAGTIEGLLLRPFPNAEVGGGDTVLRSVADGV